MSHPIESFSGDKLTEPLRKFICKICNQIPTVSGKYKLVSTNCNHLYCEYCIKEKIKTDPKCLHCKSLIEIKKKFNEPDKESIKLHKNLEIYCPYCHQKMALCKINDDEPKCRYNPKNPNNGLRKSSSATAMSDL
jgi:hypothetical protein